MRNYIRKKQKELISKRERRAARVRAKVQGTTQKPRLSVFRSHKFIYAQLIDDEHNRTLLSHLGPLKSAGEVGAQLAKKLRVKKIDAVIFDRGRYAYHGHVKALAEGARKGGLEF